MDKTAIKKFATFARQRLLADVKQKAFELGITDDHITEPVMYEDGFQVNNHFFKQYEMNQYRQLIKAIEQSNLDHVLDEVAYTWFNRIIAIRFMEVNDYLLTGIRLFSSIEPGKNEPDALTEISLLMDELQLDREIVYAFQDASDDNSLFKYVLIKQCNQLGAMMPLVFEEITGYMEILLPDYLLTEDSIIRDLIQMIPEEDWLGGVEIVGWMYQYYIAQKKDDVFAALKKNVKITKDNIPAATQLFTPRWIVEYMVDNSLGRLWLESNPNEELQDKLAYYLESTEQPEEVLATLATLKQQATDPEQITFLDPSMGSGHILIYAFEVLYEMYLSRGYPKQDIAKLILENNLYGIDIDDRATQLAYFALMMKARAYNHRIFDQSISLNVLSVKESNLLKDDDIELFIGEQEQLKDDVTKLVELYKDAKMYGSILDVSELDVEALQIRWLALESEFNDDLFALEFKEYGLPIFKQLIEQTIVLQKQYDVVVTNPPYMGRKGMSAELTKYVRKHYKDSSADLFAVFMEVSSRFVKKHGFIGMINQHAWMFLSSFEKLRKHVLSHFQIYSMAHLGTRAFAEIGGEVVQTTTFILRKGTIPDFLSTFIRLTDIKDAEEKAVAYFNKELYYQRNQDGFSDIPGSPVAYWAKPQHYKAFENALLLDEIAEVRKGLASGNTDRFIKYWYEVGYINISINNNINNPKWYPCHKGGNYRKWYGNLSKIIDWENNGYAIKNYKDKSGKLRSRPQNLDYMFIKGIVFTKITSAGSSCRIMTGKEMFDDAVQGIFIKQKDFPTEYLLALLNSPIIAEYLEILNPTMNKQINDLKRIPILKSDKYTNFNNYTNGILDLYKSDWDSFETSWDFKKHPFLTYKRGATKLSDAFKHWEEEAAHRFQTLKANEEKLNRIFIDLYGLQDELTPEVADKDVTVYQADQVRDVKSFLSYLVGVMFGRYSLDREGLVFAGGEFDFSVYTSFTPDEENIIPITDDVYFEDDIVQKLVRLLSFIFGEDHVEENLEYIADTLTRKRNETARERIRRYFMKEFYKDHMRVYQKRPIYWLIDSGRQDGVKALMYLHRYTPSLLSRFRTQYLHPLIKKYEDEISRMKMTIESDVSQTEKARAKKTIEKIEKQIGECKSFEQIVAHVSFQQMELELDDGVKENYKQFQNIAVPQGEGKPALKANILAKL